LNGELTDKFILKAVTSIIISGIIFFYYFYDMKRSDVVNKKDKIISLYFYGTSVIVIASLVAGFFFIDSPQKVRDQRHDQQVVSQLDQIDSSINEYFNQNKNVPASLADLTKEKTRTTFISEETLKDPDTQKNFDYRKMTKDTYEICATFRLSSADLSDNPQEMDKVLVERWGHKDSGKQCFSRKAVLNQAIKEINNTTTTAVPTDAEKAKAPVK
jgi:hypothetical protein